MATFVMFPSGYASAVNCDKTFLGFRPWFMGLTETVKDSSNKDICVVKSPDLDKNGEATDDEMSIFVWKIALNVLADFTILIGYISMIFVLWAGFKYMMSNGEPGKVAQAKTMLTNALIGLVISVLATVIVNTILAVFGNAAS